MENFKCADKYFAITILYGIYIICLFVSWFAFFFSIFFFSDKSGLTRLPGTSQDVIQETY